MMGCSEDATRERQPRGRKTRGLVLLWSLLLGAGGCDTWQTTTSLGSASPTRLVVLPAAFLGDVPCSSEAGAARSYVVTLSDETLCDDAGAPCSAASDCCSGTCTEGTSTASAASGTCAAKDLATLLPSSGPLSCAASLAFEQLQPGHAYSARIDVYGDPAEELRLDAGASPSLDGSPAVFRGDTQEAVPPSWTSTCGGTVSTSTEVRTHRTQHLRACVPLRQSPTGPASIQVDPSRALGSLTCASVRQWRVEPEVTQLGGAQLLLCDAGEAARFSDGVAPGRTYSFHLDGLGSDGSTLLGSTCSAWSRSGREVEASCAPLSELGSLEINVPQILELGAGACTPEVRVSLEVIPADAGVTPAVPAVVPCGPRIVYGPLGAGGREVRVRAMDQGQVLAETSCYGTVLPGRVSPCLPLEL